jgi:hypothetical protein
MDERLAVDATPEQVGELAAEHGVVLHGLVGTADLEQAFFRIIQESGRAERPASAEGAPREGARPCRSAQAAQYADPAWLLLATLGLVALTIAVTVPKAATRTLRCPSTTPASWPAS